MWMLLVKNGGTGYWWDFRDSIYGLCGHVFYFSGSGGRVFFGQALPHPVAWRGQRSRDG